MPRGRPPAPKLPEDRVRDCYDLTEEKRTALRQKIQQAHGLSGQQLDQAMIAAAIFAAGVIPLKDEGPGRKANYPIRALLHDCVKLLGQPLTARAPVEGGGESPSVSLARTIIEGIRAKPYPYDMRRLIDEAKRYSSQE